MSQTPVEQEHIINAFSFELGKVTRPYIRERVVDLLTRIDPDLASGVARNLGPNSPGSNSAGNFLGPSAAWNKIRH